MSAESRIPLERLRRGAQPETGLRYWKSLEQLAGTPEFRVWLEREFPEHAAEWTDATGRRRFLKLMGASMALAGVTGCTRQPEEKIVPYVRQPEQLVPGKPLYYATALEDRGYAEGVLVESHMGRPTKIEGNPLHPASLGACSAFGQAEILQLYDPDRSQTVSERGEIRSWGAFKTALRGALIAQQALQGEGFRILTETLGSPSLVAQLEELLAAFPKARWHQYEPAGRAESRAGARMAFGAPLAARYRLERAEVVLSLDADFVAAGPGHLRYVREFAARRRPQDESGAAMNRLYVVESAVTPTGGMADHRLPVRASEVEGYARALAATLGLPVSGGERLLSGPRGGWLRALATDLRTHPGRSLVMVGETQPAVVHALGHAINEALGGFGETLILSEPVTAAPPGEASTLAALADDMQAGSVDLLLILAGNPVYSAPADVPFAAGLERVGLRVHLALHDDETSERCDWHIPMAHALESWGDARAFDGSVSIRQPLIAPLYGGRSPHELLAAFSERPDRKAYDVIRDHWRARLGGDFEKSWRRALHDGIVPGSEAPERRAQVSLGAWALPAPARGAEGLELALRPDPKLHDGRYANNGWLQELPDPVTKLTWGNAALVSPATAAALGIANPHQTADGHVTPLARLSLGERSLLVPVWVQPGQPDGVVGLSLGYGRRRAGRVGDGVGVDAGPLRSSSAPWFSPGARLEPTGQTRILACTQEHWTIEHETATHDRHLVRSISAADYAAHPERIAALSHDPPPELSFYPPHSYDGHKWGMAVDMSACVGCNACVVACQAENNIPVVGEEQVGRGREMQWIRVDRYYHGGLENPEAFNQPLMCQHCENAPCEVVCPVAATVHSDEGLNDMVYNRCVGTRYCSNNCPYKVRRFNFLLYQDWETPSLKLQRNPDVSVRSRGVMEKCSYCVQRISQARIEARNDDRELRDGDIKTACQQTCPAQAIVFGDLNDAESAVSKLKRAPRDYGLLTDTGTRPRTSYLAALRNPNPALAGDEHG